MSQIGNFIQAPHVMIKRRREKTVEKPIHSALNGAPLGDGDGDGDSGAISVSQQKIFFVTLLL
jgi:hypothetical protein